jgi:alkylated DNA repair dioxygenase AlkB
VRPAQPSLFPDDGTAGLPDGFLYRPAAITLEDEAQLVGALQTLPFAPFQFHGYTGARRVVSFGWRYGFGDGGLQPAQPMPGFLLPLRRTAAALAGVEPDQLPHVLLTEYAPGAGIGWHRDRPEFGKVVGVSLAAPCLFRFRRRTPEGFERVSLTLAPRSAYLLDGPARTVWEHSIPGVQALRYSITFRTLRP